MSINPID